MYKKIKEMLVASLIAITLITIVTVNMPYLFTLIPAFAGVPSEPHTGNAIWIEDADAPYWAVNLTTANPAHTIGYKFNITVWVNWETVSEEATGIDSWQFKLTFNKTYLNATRCGYTAGKTSQLFEGMSTTPVTPFIDNDKGYVMHFETVAPYVKSVPCTGSLSWIEFEVIKVPAKGETLTAVFNIKNDDTWVADDYGIYYDGKKYGHNGYYEFKWEGELPTYTLTISSTAGGTTDPAPGAYTYTEGTRVNVTAIPTTGYALDHWKLDDVNVGNPNPIQITMDTNHTLQAFFIPLGTILYVDPPEIINPTMGPGSTFEINVTVDDVSNMLTCEFNLTYDTNVLTCIIIQAFKVQNQTPTPNIMFNDEIGYVWVKLKFKSPVTTTAPIPLVRITFEVDAMGVTPLDLTDTALTDSTGEPIPHTAIDGFFAALIQDLSITNVVVSSNWVYKGQPVDISVTVKNLGNQKESFDVKAYYNTTLLGTQQVTDLDPNAETTLTFTWDTSTAETGKNYTIKAEVTVLPYETNTGDNTYIDGNVEIYARDIAITNVIASRDWVYQGWTVTINVTAKNLGDLPESFNVSAYYNTTELIGTEQVTDLLPNAEITLTFTWNTSLVQPCHNYTITGAATVLLYEQNTLNDVYHDGNVKVRFVGDLNGDDRVDGKDVRSAAAAFASYPGHPRWNPDADINQDGRIDGRDIRVVCKNFGLSCGS